MMTNKSTKPHPPGEAWWRLMTAGSAGGSAAIGVFQVWGDVDRAFGALKIAAVGVGEVKLRGFSDIDRGVVARPSAETLVLMPHAGPAVMRKMEAWLESSGLLREGEDDPQRWYPEASSLMEARMLRALARAASPLAVDMLLDQLRRWEKAGAVDEHDEVIAARSRVLNRLIDPPTVVALGRPNIGKSTLLNVLAGRGVSIVADEAGTTRDHVGVRLELAGLVVNYIDTPGINAGRAVDGIQREAQELALDAARGADLVLLCADARSGFVEDFEEKQEAPPPLRPMRVGLRADLGLAAGAEVSVVARTGEGVERLVGEMKERLLPLRVLADEGPWRFW